VGENYIYKTLQEAVAHMYLKGGDFDNKITEIANGQYITNFFRNKKKVAVYNHLIHHLYIF
jgi:hypothetical protein